LNHFEIHSLIGKGYYGLIFDVDIFDKKLVRKSLSLNKREFDYKFKGKKVSSSASSKVDIIYEFEYLRHLRNISNIITYEFCTFNK